MLEKKNELSQGCGETEIIIDLFGPIIDVSRIPDFKGVDSVRYLSENDIAKLLNLRYKRDYGWRKDDIIERTLDILTNSKLKTRLIDVDVVKQICRAKKYCKIIILSDVPKDELFNVARDLIIEYSKNIIKVNHSIDDTVYVELDEMDFKHTGIRSYLKTSVVKGIHRIVLDDNIDYSAMINNDDLCCVQRWISALDSDDFYSDLKYEIDDRIHLHNSEEAVNSLCKYDEKLKLNYIKLEDVQLMDGFYVFDSRLRARLKNTIHSIEALTHKDLDKNKPICVFLAGKPGTGKSYFVELLSCRFNKEKDYITASLSGVSNEDFTEAVKNHIKKVYDYEKPSTATATIAFLDEVDTKGESFAFRLLMDAMSGKRMDEHGGVVKKGKNSSIENLIWFFAGSGGVTREEFIDRFKEDERKVTDFFDRIHFDIQLPSVDNPGQAILTLISTLIKYMHKTNQNDLYISQGVLLLFARTRWKSARQITTICRVAQSKDDFDLSSIRLKLFEDVYEYIEFKKAFSEIQSMNIEDGNMYKILEGDNR